MVEAMNKLHTNDFIDRIDTSQHFGNTNDFIELV